MRALGGGSPGRDLGVKPGGGLLVSSHVLGRPGGGAGWKACSSSGPQLGGGCCRREAVASLPARICLDAKDGVLEPV